MTNESTDCLQCRLVSGGGLITAGAYVFYQSKKLKSFSRHVIAAIGSATGLLGVLRIFALPPFRQSQPKEESVESTQGEDSQYIIGKFPTKFQ